MKEIYKFIFDRTAGKEANSLSPSSEEDYLQSISTVG
jgi:hypothetical protein